MLTTLLSKAWIQMSKIFLYISSSPTHLPLPGLPAAECQERERRCLWPRVIFTYVSKRPAQCVGGHSMTTKQCCWGHPKISTYWQVTVEEAEVQLQSNQSDIRQRCNEYMKGSIRSCGSLVHRQNCICLWLLLCIPSLQDSTALFLIVESQKITVLINCNLCCDVY